MECDASIMRYIDECLENPPAYFKDDWTFGTSPRASFEEYDQCLVVPEKQQPNELLAYEHPVEDEAALHSFHKQSVQQQQAEEMGEVDGELDHIVPTFGMPYDSPFISADHFESFPLAPVPSKETNGKEDDWNSAFFRQADFEDAVVLEMDRPQERLAYDEPAEEDPVFYDLDESPERQEAYGYLEDVQQMAEQRVPIFGMPFDPPFHPVEDYDPVPADPSPPKAASGNEGDGEEPSDNQTKGRKRGISKRKANARRADRLYEFTYRLLSNWNRYKDVVEWIDWENGLWRVVDSDEYARLWGVHKRNPKMTYKTLGRGLRYAYAWGILEEHGPQNLVQQFTPAFRCLTPFSPPSSPRR